MLTGTSPDDERFPEWASEEARAAASSLLHRFPVDSSEPVLITSQRIHSTPLLQLRVLLEEMVPLPRTRADRNPLALSLAESLSNGFPLIPSEHLSLFTPLVPSSALGQDGSDQTFNPPAPFTRRMWAGGEMHFSHGRPLTVEQVAEERTWIERVDIKRTKAGDEMLVVWVRKEIGDGEGESIVDLRSWVFQRTLDPSAGSRKLLPEPSRIPAEEVHRPLHVAQPSTLGLAPGATPVIQTPATLFRYSALTYNAHAIHLDAQWAREREGHPTTVVHGPMTLSLLLRKWLAINTSDPSVKGLAQVPQLGSVNYRAKRPLWTGERYWVGCQEGQEDTMLAVKDDGTVVMEASISRLQGDATSHKDEHIRVKRKGSK
ncbi:hypothetical protein CBOM_04061 [Ceraceosorus bombacis]|uniref:Uncharacterized protein n=1 Tax=Ceraceosorus bombacis TaxID=401625 RepID=A0A0P1BLL9_9BASI|nr:hypothetical protein CBOM_04061 [Ceraceosorus bombacis]